MPSTGGVEPKRSTRLNIYDAAVIEKYVISAIPGWLKWDRQLRGALSVMPLYPDLDALWIGLEVAEPTKLAGWSEFEEIASIWGKTGCLPRYRNSRTKKDLTTELTFSLLQQQLMYEEAQLAAARIAAGNPKASDLNLASRAGLTANMEAETSRHKTWKMGKMGRVARRGGEEDDDMLDDVGLPTFGDD